jgi:hypothetical protein
VFDLTTGRSASSGQMSSIGGHPASEFYDPTTAEFITERPTKKAGSSSIAEPLGSRMWEHGRLSHDQA